MKIKEAGITILVSADSTTIELHDRLSSVRIATVTLTATQFSQALSRLSNTDCKIEVYDKPDLLNKELEVSKHNFPIPEDLDRGDRDKLHKLAIKTCPKGWAPDKNYGSQDSFYIDESGQKYARVTIRRWVDNTK